MRTRCRIAALDPTLLRRPGTWRVGFCIWFVVLWVLSSQSPPDLPPPRIPHLDKLAHALYFGCGGFLLGTGLALGPQKGFPRTRCLASLALLAIIGALDEWHQVFTAGRQGADPYDWLADVCGAATGLTLVRYVEARLREW